MSNKSLNAPVSGHAPGHLRQALLDALGTTLSFVDAMSSDVLDFFDNSRQSWWNALSNHHRALWIIDQLWNCGDVLPGWACDELDMPHGSTYAQAARSLRATMAKPTAMANTAVASRTK